MHEIGSSGDGFDHRYAVGAGEGGERFRRLGILHAAPGDDDRFARPRNQAGGVGNVARIGRRTTNAVHALLEELFRIVVRPSLHVLGQTEESRSAIGGVEHGGDRLRQGLQDLRRMHDPVPEPRHRLESVIHAERRVAEMLDLLQNGIG